MARGVLRAPRARPPDEEEVRGLLDLAGTAAHSSERTAAPIACWLAGRANPSFDELDEIAGSIGPPADDD